jgi:hypothetical protein
MIQQVLAEPEWQGRLTAADLRALSPLKVATRNPYGTFTLNMRGPLALLLRGSGSSTRSDRRFGILVVLFLGD